MQRRTFIRTTLATALAAAFIPLIFLPGMAAVAEAGGWRPVVLAVAAVMAVLVPVVWLL